MPRGKKRGGTSAATSRRKQTATAESAPYDDAEAPSTAGQQEPETAQNDQTSTIADAEPRNDGEATPSADTASDVTIAAAETPSAQRTAAASTSSRPGSSRTSTSRYAPPVQRLDSIRGPGSALSSLRGSPSSLLGRARGAMPQPRNVQRRSKEEREAMERAAAERQRARLDGMPAPASGFRPSRPALAGRGSGGEGRGGASGFQERARGRGGGWRGRARGRAGLMNENRASGPFSSGVALTEAKKVIQTGARSSGSSTHAGTTRSKKASAAKREGRVDARGEVKREDGGYISSSDSDQEKEGPRKDVDTINLASDEEEDDDPIITKVTSKIPFRSVGLAPVRVSRKAHVDRVRGVNTDASSATSAELRRQARERGADEAVSVEAATASALRKGKFRAVDVEVLEQRRRFKGVWSDDEDEKRIKDEPAHDTTSMEVDVANDSTRDVGEAGSSNVQPQQSEPSRARKSTLSPERGRKDSAKPTKSRQKHPREGSPLLQTKEERLEHEIMMSDRATLWRELGTLHISPSVEKKDEASGDTAMGEADGAPQPQPEPLVNNRDGHVYLFQLPPVLPDLVPVSSDEKPADSEPALENGDAHNHPVDLTSNSIAGPTSSTPAVTQETQHVITDTADTDLTTATTSRWPNLTPGKMGKLQVHESGRAYLSWGGIKMEVRMGIQARHAQHAVVVDPQTPEGGGGGSRPHAPRAGGDAMCLGQIKASFVVTPDLDAMLSAYES